MSVIHNGDIDTPIKTLDIYNNWIEVSSKKTIKYKDIEITVYAEIPFTKNDNVRHSPEIEFFNKYYSKTFLITNKLENIDIKPNLPNINIIYSFNDGISNNKI